MNTWHDHMYATPGAHIQTPTKTSLVRTKEQMQRQTHESMKWNRTLRDKLTHRIKQSLIRMPAQQMKK